jgi:transposase
MNKEIPRIKESVEELKHMLKHEHNGRKKQRLQALFLLQSRQASRRTEVASVLGVNRDTVGRWLSDYAQGGLKALLEVYTPVGRKPTICGEILESLGEKLACPEGFGSYDEIRVWLEHNYKVNLKYKTIYNVVRYRLGAKLKVARPSHIKKLRTNRAILPKL